MNAEDVTKIVQDQIAGDWSHTNAHDCDLRRCLVAPTKGTFLSYSPGRCDPFELWLILEEHPGTQEGYMIVYDDEEKVFGLACYQEEEKHYLGEYGRFFDAYDSM